MGEIILGIDLGTTFFTVAYVDEKGTPRLIHWKEPKSFSETETILLRKSWVINGG